MFELPFYLDVLDRLADNSRFLQTPQFSSLCRKYPHLLRAYGVHGLRLMVLRALAAELQTLRVRGETEPKVNRSYILDCSRGKAIQHKTRSA